MLARSDGGSARTEEPVLSMTAMIIGAMAVARTTDDAALKAKLLASCREKARALRESGREYVSPVHFCVAPPN